MKVVLCLSVVGAFCLAGCETKVVTNPPPSGQTTVVHEYRDRPAEPAPAPAVKNDIHVDR